MRLGIGSYALMWSIGFPGAEHGNRMDAFAVLACARELGVGVVQFGPNLPIDLLAESELVRLRQQALADNIQLECGTRGLAPSHLQKHISLARRLSSNILRTVPDFEVGQAPEISEIARELRRILPELESNNVRLAIENGNIPARELSRLMNELDSPWIGVTLDTANSLAVIEGTHEVVKALAPHVLSFHVKDFVVHRLWHRMGFIVEGRPAGKGQVDFLWIFAQLQAAGADPNAILELWPPEQSEIEATVALERAWAEESVQYLRKYLPH
jgi:sugar phosphate isomerase/epimerase